MALVVETGSGSATAESYISAADADTYFTEHQSPGEWTGLTTAQKEGALRYAATWMDERYNWLGVIANTTAPQALAWPRSGVVDKEGRSISSTSIPTKIKHLQCEVALAHVKSKLNEFYSRGGAIASESAEGASVSYFASASIEAAYPYLDKLAAPYVFNAQVLLRA